MRMWMVDPKIMCQQHLCGEHVELHMFIGHLRLKRRVDGYLENNCLEPRMIFERHNAIKNEMLKRGYNHKTPINEIDCECILYLPPEKQYWEINKQKSLSDLLERCSRCKGQYEKTKLKKKR